MIESRALAFRGSSIVALIAAAFLALHVSAQSTNLIVNGGFDGSLNGWTKFATAGLTTTYVSSDASGKPGSGSALSSYSGTQVQSGSVFFALFQRVAVAGGASYTLSGKEKRVAGVAALAIGWSDANQQPLGTGSFNAIPSGPTDVNGWTPVSVTQTAPANAAYATIYTGVEVAPGASTYFDEITVIGPPPPPPPLQAPTFSANPTAVRAGSSATLTWNAPGAASVVIDNGIGAVGTRGVFTVTPSKTTTYTLTATSGAGATRTATATVNVISTSALTIANPPSGLLQAAGTGGGTDRVSVRNSGGATAKVKVTTSGTFFSASPTSFDLAAGETATVTLTATAQPAGFFNGTIQFSDSANPGTNASAAVQLLSAPPPAGSVNANATTPRVDVSAPASTPASGSVSFRNEGTATLQGIAVSDQPWLVPQSGLISIAPGQTVDVSFAIDPTKVPADSLQIGTVTASLALTYATGGPGAKTGAAGTASRASTSALVNYTGSPSTSSGPIPALAGAIAYFLPTAVNQPGLVSDFVAINGNSSPTSDFSLLFAPTGSSTALRAEVGALPGNTILRFSDIVSRVFQKKTQLGTVQLRSSDLTALTVAASLIDTENSAVGTFIGTLQASRSDRSARRNQTIVLNGLRKDPDTVTHLFLQEVSGTATTTRTDFVDQNGTVISSRSDNLAAFGALSAFDAAPERSAAAIITNTGDGAVVARGLLKHIQSRDNTDLVDWALTNGASSSGPQIIPFAVRNIRSGATSKTSLAVTNRSATDTLVATLEYRSAGQGRRRAAVHAASSISVTDAKTISIPPRQTVVYDDVLDTLGVASATSGAILFLPASGSAALQPRIDDQTDGVGSFSTTLPVSPAPIVKGDLREFGGFDDAAAETVQRRTSNSYRSAFGFAETSGNTATVKVTLYSYSYGARTVTTPFAERTYTLRAFEYRYFADLTSELLGPKRDETFRDLHSMHVIFEVTDGDGAVIPFVVTTESATGDRLVRSGPF